MRYFVFIALVISSVALTAFTTGQKPALRKVASEEVSKTISDVVKKIREDDEGLVVLFEKNAGSYYLQRANENFARAQASLQKSLKDKKPVSVTVEVADLNILEVK